MSETLTEGSESGNPSGEPTAGGMLRQARQAQGLHIAALAAAIKVTPRKLEMLEADRFDELPDATFARALAQTVCRTLKIDAEPVLAKLPLPPQMNRLEHVTRGLNEPFRDRMGSVEGFDRSVVLRPVVWGPALLLIATIVVYFIPPGTWRLPNLLPAGGSASAPAATEVVTTTVPAAAPPASEAAASAPDAVLEGAASAGSAVVETVHSAPPPGEDASAPAAPQAAAATAAPKGPLVLRASSESWVEVRDAAGQVLLSRSLLAGESVGLDGAMPLRLKIGNAEGTEVSFRGKPVELTPFVRDNVARLEVK
ncbi:helix-turn-helix domain-containing protein [Methylibium rhizosphaerae]|uniref:helix-turn-helix domain-containing protein n=1 Tax=Methylibium rhizosphaerae TaxID=2570323 RepID=UPI001128FF9F|nr:helix-turn-helix domain-containing protein [Methylibium rhizosphaerae]